MGLPEEYSHIVTMTETLSDADYNPRKIESLIVGEFSQRQANAEALHSLPTTDLKTDLLLSRRSPVKRRDTQRSPWKHRKEERRCYVCNKPGQIPKNCKKRKKSPISPTREKSKSSQHRTTMLLTNEVGAERRCVGSHDAGQNSFLYLASEVNMLVWRTGTSVPLLFALVRVSRSHKSSPRSRLKI